jgi:hypothetical protein
VTLWAYIRRPILLQEIYVVLSVAWNLAGVLLIEQGLRAPGPTASLGVAAFLLAVGLGMLLGARRLPLLYVATSGLIGAGALAAVIQAFQLDPALWPATSWRYAGVLLNGLGVLGTAWGIVVWLRWRRSPASDSAQ